MPAALWPLWDRSLLVVDEGETWPSIDLRDPDGALVEPLARGLAAAEQLGEVVAAHRPGTVLVLSERLVALGLALDAIEAMADTPALEVRSRLGSAEAMLHRTTRHTTPQLTMRLSGELDDAARSRAVLTAWFSGTTNVDALVLVASELVTNATRYGSGHGQLTLAVDGGVALLGVEDGGSTIPKPRADVGHHGGFGLRLVHRLCRAWGVAPRGNGKEVWAEVELGDTSSDAVLVR